MHKPTNLLLIVVSLAVFAVFVVSACQGYWLDIFFIRDEQVHDMYKVDFFQVPAAADTFFSGGPLGGTYSGINIPNVYHPLFTIVVGGILLFFQQDTSYFLWIIAHAVVWFVTGWYVYKTFRNNAWIGIAMLFFFGLFPHYLEIRNGQYHVLLNSLLTVLLVYATKKRVNQIQEALIYTGSLLVKPVTLLWAFAYIQEGRKRTAIIGICLFGVITLLFATASFILNRDVGLYYLANLLAHMSAADIEIPQIFTIDALFRIWGVPFYHTSFVKILIGLGIIVWAHIKRPPLFIQLFIWTSFYLLFYDLVYEYHYTTLAPFFTIGILTQKIFRRPWAIMVMATYLLPTPYVLMKLINMGVTNDTVTMTGWTVLVLWRTIPLTLMALEMLDLRSKK